MLEGRGESESVQREEVRVCLREEVSVPVQREEVRVCLREEVRVSQSKGKKSECA